MIAGVQGNGQTEVTEALLGLQHHVTGSIRLDDQELAGESVRTILDAGVGFVPEDRQNDGLVSTFTIAENLMLDRSHGKHFTSYGSVQRGQAQHLRPGEARAVRHPRPRHLHPRRQPVGGQPAEGRRRA